MDKPELIVSKIYESTWQSQSHIRYKKDKQWGRQNALQITVEEWAIQPVLEKLTIHVRRTIMPASYHSQNLICKGDVRKPYNRI